MTELLPTTAYDLLEPEERAAVDEYVNYAIEQQLKRRERILSAISKPIPTEYIRRSKDALYKPLLRAAIAERIREAARLYDISPDRVIHENAKIAFSEFTDFIEAGQFGEIVIKDINTIPKDKLGAIKSLEAKPTPLGMSYKVVLHDKLPALKTLGELMGLVSPDNPAPLRDYVAAKAESERLEMAPEKAYVELLEAIGT